MKKLSIFFIVLALLMVSVAVFADDPLNRPIVEDPYGQHVNDDGVVVWGETGNQYNNVTTLNRTGYTLDTNGKDQLAQLNVEALAYIPCYLKLTFNGNQGKTVVESFGPKGDNGLAQAVGDIPSQADGNYHIIFDNEVGGFVDDKWASLGHGRNAEVRPGEKVYIQACDIFQVNIFSNDDFKYDVISAPLTGAGNRKLTLEMGTSSTIDGVYTPQVFDSAKTINIGTGAPCTSLKYFHRFRVPYSESTVHGAYSGTITFKAYTI